MTMYHFDLAELSLLEQKMSMVSAAAAFEPDVSTREGYDKSKRMALDITKLLSMLEAKRKELKAPIIEAGRQIDEEANKIKAALEQARLPHQTAYKAADAAVKERKRRFEADIQGRIDAVRELVSVAAASTADEVAEMIETIRIDPMENCYHRSVEALQVRDSVVATLQTILDGKRELDALRAQAPAVEPEPVEPGPRREFIIKARPTILAGGLTKIFCPSCRSTLPTLEISNSWREVECSRCGFKGTITQVTLTIEGG